MSRNFFVTRNYSTELIGQFSLMLPLTDAELINCVIAPTYVKHDDGTVELTEMSLIPAEQAAQLIQRGMEKNAPTNTPA